MPTFVRNLVLAAGLAGVVAATAPGQPKDKGKAEPGAGTVEVYKDKAGEFRWRVKDADGKVVAMPPKGYDTKDDCLKALAAVKATLGKAKTTEIKDDAEPKK